MSVTVTYMDGPLAAPRPGRGTLRAEEFPSVLQRAGATACFAEDEFFSARISNWETRRAYGRAVGWFFQWCDQEVLELAHITPGLAGRFIRSLEVSDATKNQALAARKGMTPRSLGDVHRRSAASLQPVQKA